MMNRQFCEPGADGHVLATGIKQLSEITGVLADRLGWTLGGGLSAGALTDSAADTQLTRIFIYENGRRF